MKKLIILLLLSVAVMGIELGDMVLAKKVSTLSDGITFSIEKEDIVNSFQPNDKDIFVQANYKNGKIGSKFRIAFISINALAEPNTEITEVAGKITRKKGTLNATFSREEVPFPVGKYRIDIYADNQKIGTKTFSVDGSISNLSPASAHIGQERSIPVIGQIVFAKKVYIDDKGMSVPEGMSDHFSPDQHNITMVATYNNAQAKEIFSIRWIAVEAGTIHNKTFFEEKLSVERPKGALQDEMANPDDWPEGHYRVEIYFGQKRLAGKDFWIQKLALQQTRGNTAPSPLQHARMTSIGNERSFTPPVGRWVADTKSGEQVMEILSPTEIRYNGKSFHCRIDDKNIVIIDGTKHILYPYKVNGNRLVLHYANGSTRTFVKKEHQNVLYDPLSATESPTQPAQPAKKATPLEKLYCSNSADGNEWVQFKPNGLFYFGSLLDRGTPYGSGKYTMRQNTIDIAFDGERGVARIIKKSADDRISAIQYDGVVYASGLCP